MATIIRVVNIIINKIIIQLISDEIIFVELIIVVFGVLFKHLFPKAIKLFKWH